MQRINAFRLLRTCTRMIPKRKKKVSDFHEIDGQIYKHDKAKNVLVGVSKNVKGKIITLAQKAQ